MESAAHSGARAWFVGVAASTVLGACLAGGCGGETVAALKCKGAEPVAFTDDRAQLAAELRACAFDVSCAETAWWWTYDDAQGRAARSCLADWNLNGLDGVVCAPNATSCDGWLACATHGHCSAWCAAEGYQPNAIDLWTCDGDDVIVCGDSDYGVVVKDCETEGMRCQTVGYGVSSAAACTDGNACTQPSNPQCVGNKVVGCDASTLLEQSQDCAATGEQCVTIDFPLLGTTASCGSGGGTPCDPNTFVSSCRAPSSPVACLGSLRAWTARLRRLRVNAFSRMGTRSACRTRTNAPRALPTAVTATIS